MEEKERKLESFVRVDLIKYIRTKVYRKEAEIVGELAWIEHKRKHEELSLEINRKREEVQKLWSNRDYLGFFKMNEEIDLALDKLHKLSMGGK